MTVSIVAPQRLAKAHCSLAEAPLPMPANPAHRVRLDTEMPMYSMDDFLRLNSADGFSRSLERNRQRAGIRVRQRNTDVDAFLSACGIKGKRK